MCALFTWWTIICRHTHLHTQGESWPPVQSNATQHNSPLCEKYHVETLFSAFVPSYPVSRFVDEILKLVKLKIICWTRVIFSVSFQPPRYKTQHHNGHTNTHSTHTYIDFKGSRNYSLHPNWGLACWPIGSLGSPIEKIHPQILNRQKQNRWNTCFPHNPKLLFFFFPLWERGLKSF